MNISLTEKAISRIKTLLQQHDNSVFRIVVKPTGCNGWKYAPEIVDEQKTTDFPVKVGDLTIYVDKDSKNFLEGIRLDCVDKNLGMWQWSFENPNATGSCGCGGSFSVKKSEKE